MSKLARVQEQGFSGDYLVHNPSPPSPSINLLFFFHLSPYILSLLHLFTHHPSPATLPLPIASFATMPPLLSPFPWGNLLIQLG